jgi:hypothetical protein
MSLQSKIIIIVVIAVAILGGVYLFFFNSSSDTSAVGPDNSQSATVAETKFVELSTQAQSINFDTSIFSDPRFTALVDTRTSVIPVQTGRPDPFALYSGEAQQ